MISCPLESIGIWKEKFIDWMNPQTNSKLIDVASGTGDIAKLFLNKLNFTAHATCWSLIKKCLKQGKIN